MARGKVLPFLLAAFVVVSLWVAGPSGVVGFIVRSPIILMNDLLSILRYALGPSQTTASAVQVRQPLSTSGLAASLQVLPPNAVPHAAQPSLVPLPAPTSPPGGVVPPPDTVLAPVEEILKPAGPVLGPIQNAVDPIVDSVGSALEPVTGLVESLVGPVTDTIGGSGGGTTPNVGGAVHDVKNALEKIGLP